MIDELVARCKIVAEALPADGDIQYADRVSIQDELTSTSPSLPALLGVASAQKAWYVWTSRFPDDLRPLEIAEEALAGRADPAQLRRRAGSLWTMLDDLAESDFAAYAAGAAWLMVASEILDGPHGLVPREESDSYDWDAAFWASLAISGGGTWMPGSDPVARRDFGRVP